MNLLLIILIALVMAYLVFGLAVVITYETVTNITGVFKAPKWIETLYDFVIDYWFGWLN